jgi:hypothetical protein
VRSDSDAVPPKRKTQTCVQTRSAPGSWIPPITANVAMRHAERRRRQHAQDQRAQHIFLYFHTSFLWAIRPSAGRMIEFV